MSVNRDIELIEAYLQNHLSPEERIHIESRIKSDEEFAILFKQERAVIKAVSDRESQEFLASVSEVMKKSESPKILSFSNLRKGLMAAAATVALIFAASYLFRQEVSPAELYDEYFETYPLISVQRDHVNEELISLIAHYENANWNLVLKDMETIDSSLMPIALNKIYSSIAYLQIEEAGKAIELLMQYETIPAPNIYQEQILWYLSLAYLKAGKRDDAHRVLRLLEETLADSSKMKSDVRSLLKKLK